MGFRNDPPCKFTLWKNNKYFEAIGLNFTKKIAMDFLKKGCSAPVKLVSKKTGKEYEAIIVMTANQDGTIAYSMKFPNKE